MVELYPHNKKAVEAIEKHYREGNRKAAIVHATGTGKSFIIAAIVDKFKKCIVIAPNDYVLEETRKICKDSTYFATYSALMYNNVTITDYDLIVLDEFHRAGALQWGEAVKDIIEANPNARLLGTTATDIRYLDGMRNMSDELFDGNVVSRLSLSEAWVQKILLPPVYITGLYTFDKIAENLKDRVKDNKRLSENDKSKALSSIEGVRLDWIKADGLSDIFRKHLRKDTKRIVVFCEHISHIEDVMTQSIQWFANAGFRVYKTYTANFMNKNSSKEIEHFEEDDFEGVKIMFSVNMLNEGIHVPNVDAVVMLRPTSSKIIHLQQIGRCMTTDNKNRPVVFDLVDNLNNSSAIKDELAEYTKLVGTEKKHNDESDKVDFLVKDYVHDIRNVVEILENTFIPFSFEDKVKQLSEWCEEHQRLPFSYKYTKCRLTEEQIKEKRYRHFMYAWKHKREIIELRKKYFSFLMVDDDKKKEILLDFVSEHHKLPRQNAKDKAERSLSYYMTDNREDEDIKAIMKEYEYRYCGDSEDKRQEILEWCKEHNGLPVNSNQRDRYQRNLARHIERHKNEPFYAELLVRYDFKTKNEKKEQDKQFLIAFCKKNGRKPKRYCEEEKEAFRIYRRVSLFRGEEEWFKELVKSIKTK